MFYTLQRHDSLTSCFTYPQQPHWGQKTTHSLLDIQFNYESAQPLAEEALFFAVSVQKCRTTPKEALFFAESVQNWRTNRWGDGYLFCINTEVQNHSLRRRVSLLYLYRSAQPLTKEAGFFAVSVQKCITTHWGGGFLYCICTEVHNHSLRRRVSLLYLYRSAQQLSEEACFFAVSVQKCTTTHWGGVFLCCICT